MTFGHAPGDISWNVSDDDVGNVKSVEETDDYSQLYDGGEDPFMYDPKYSLEDRKKYLKKRGGLFILYKSYEEGESKNKDVLLDEGEESSNLLSMIKQYCTGDNGNLHLNGICFRADSVSTGLKISLHLADFNHCAFFNRAPYESRKLVFNGAMVSTTENTGLGDKTMLILSYDTESG